MLRAAAGRALFEGHVARGSEQVAARLLVFPEWSQREVAIARSFRFRDYDGTIAFVNALTFMVHREDHHPDPAVGCNRCDVRFSTHSVGGIPEYDIVRAAMADAIFAQRHGTVA